jgi:cell division protein FtsB
MILELRNEVDKLKIQNKKLRAEIKELASGGR